MSEDLEPEEERRPERSATELWVEVGAASLVVFLLVLAVTLVAAVVPFVSGMLYVIVAAIFVYLPWWWIERMGYRLEDFGIATDHLGRDVVWGLLLSVLTLIPFAVGFWVWETQWVGHEFTFEWSNYKRWAPKWEGEPEEWGGEPGAWVWTRDRTVNVGLDSGDAGEVTVRVRTDRRHRPRLSGPGNLEYRGDPADGGAHWEVTVPRDADGRVRLQIAPEEAGTANYVRRVDIEVVRPRAIPIRAGPGETVVEDGRFSIQRGLRWLGLWLMTQLVFIALPEEFFYRGYLQTRIRHALEQTRRERGRAAESRSWWGVSEENLAASAIFGVGHLLIPIGGQLMATRIAVAFPSVLFGGLRDRTGSITASVVYHAACNMMVLVAAPHFF